MSVATSIALGGMAVALVSGHAHGVRAATPSSGTLDAPTSQLTVSWANSSPMAGALAPARRNTGCATQPTACDDFSLNMGGLGSFNGVSVVVTPSAGAQMTVLLYDPNCPHPPGPTDAGCYAIEGLVFNLYGPAAGNYLLRTVCTQCAPGSSYTARASLANLPPSLPGPGDQSFAWSQQGLPMPSGTSSGEPGISTNNLNDGTHVNIIVNTFGPTVWTSTNDGATFSQPDSTIDTTMCPSGDADAVVDTIGTLYADNLCTGGPTNLSYTSTDGGTMWNASTSGLPAPAGTDSDRQWYAIDPFHAGTIYMSFHDFEGALARVPASPASA